MIYFNSLKKYKRKVLFISALFIFVNHPSFSQTWIRCSNGLPPDTAVFSLARIGTTLYAGTQHAGVYKSTDGGDNWINTNLNDPDRQGTIRSLAVMDTFLFAGEGGNGVARTTLNGSSWTAVNNGIPKGPGYRSIFEIIVVGDTLFAASGGAGVFMSTDKGDNWTKL